jgi:hypothetical protein
LTVHLFGINGDSIKFLHGLLLSDFCYILDLPCASRNALSSDLSSEIMFCPVFFPVRCFEFQSVTICHDLTSFRIKSLLQLSPVGSGIQTHFYSYRRNTLLHKRRIPHRQIAPVLRDLQLSRAGQAKTEFADTACTEGSGKKP